MPRSRRVSAVLLMCSNSPIAIGMLLSFGGFVRCLQAVPVLAKQFGHRLVADADPVLGEQFGSAHWGALARPSQRRFRVTTRHRRVTGSMSFSSARRTSGCVSNGLGPALRRTLTTSSRLVPPRPLSRPFRTVLIASPVARATAATPPNPIATASALAHIIRSVSTRSGGLVFNASMPSRPRRSRAGQRSRVESRVV